ncbi:MAG: hypothetical protein JEZ08_04565 [Clostridiales bacterium]|nr:hypothetical protein [Clostridiales bacterium]
MKKIFIFALLLTVVIAGVYYANQLKETKSIENFKLESKAIAVEYEAVIADNPSNYEFVNNYIIGDSAYAFVLDENFNLIVHPIEGLLDKSMLGLVSSELDETLYNLCQDTPQAFMRYKWQNKDKMIFFHKASDGTILGISAGTIKGY